ncbi:MAG TPA: adenosylcobinamide-GDP ribazoletransferase [Chloroflexi bacterium]|nr:adenosylcobinamide-GDP ribazoletransferase [Chloroflexota bacterium]HHW89009.1 adenosylcobinamide-GDP ribazoletransferase [Chloroflexota bacterium]
MDSVWCAIGFLTTLPVPSHTLPPDALRRAGVWFPVVGLLIGALLAGAAWGLGWLFPPAVTAVLVVALWAALTGALHLDGLADCGDGLLPPVRRERRLEIMRDPRVGAFGVTVLVLTLLLKAAALASLTATWPALLLAPIWARWLILAAARQPSARPEGMGASLGPVLDTPRLAFAALLPLVLTGGVSVWHAPVLAAAGGAVLAALGVLWLAQRRLGGVTGDVFGAVVEVSEAVFVCIACVQW